MSHSQRPSLEPLEARRVPVGFFEGTPAAPIQVFLNGLAHGVALVRPAPDGVGSVVTISAVGRVSPLGRTTITGKLRIEATGDFGFLVLNAPRSLTTLGVHGSAGEATTLNFQVVDGKALPTAGTYSYVVEKGGGSVGVTLAPGAGRVPLTLVFQSVEKV